MFVLALGCVLPQAASAGRYVEIETLSNRADVVSADDALVAVTLPDGASRFTATIGEPQRDRRVQPPRVAASRVS